MKKELSLKFLTLDKWDFCLAVNEQALVYLGLTSAYIKDLASFYPHHSYRQSQNHPHLLRAQAQLAEYWHGERRHFDLVFHSQGTEFQEAVWQACRQIPYGQTACYQKLANQIGHPRAARAVGTALKRNPLLIVTPCHRVLTKTGKNTGFRAGRDLKDYLLAMETEPLKVNEK